MNWSRVNRAACAFQGCKREERERTKFANSARCWFMIYEFSPDIAMCFQLHWAALPLFSLSLSSCVSTLSARMCKRKTRFAAISHSLNLFRVQEKVWSFSLPILTRDGKIIASREFHFHCDTFNALKLSFFNEIAFKIYPFGNLNLMKGIFFLLSVKSLVNILWRLKFWNASFARSKDRLFNFRTIMDMDTYILVLLELYYKILTELNVFDKNSSFRKWHLMSFEICFSPKNR